MANTPLPKTIKAVHQLDIHSSHLSSSETPLPTPDSTDYLILVKATSPCRHELTWEAIHPHIFPAERERVPGTEAAGVVVSAPDNGRFKPGDEVFFRTYALQTGALREYTLAKEEQMALKPKRLSWIEAAATPLSALTAWQGLFVHGTLDKKALYGDEEALRSNSEKRVLVTGAGGGVGSWAVQFAAASGAKAVVAVCSASKAEEVKALGATEIIDYTKQSISEWVKDDEASREFDYILDCVGGSTLKACWTAIKEGGTLLTISNGFTPIKPEGMTKNVAKAEWYLVESSGSHLSEISELIDGGKYTPLVDSVFEFENFAEAFEKVEQGHAKGKVVIKVNDLK